MNLIENEQPDIEKDYLFVKDLFESKYQLLVNKRGKVGIKKIKIIHKQLIMSTKIWKTRIQKRKEEC